MKLITLYRTHVPPSLRKKIYRSFIGNPYYFIIGLKPFIRGKITYLFRFWFPKTEENKAWAFMGKYGQTPYPFEGSLAYKDIKIEVHSDDSTGLQYVFHQGNRLFFPNNISSEDIIKTYRSLITEQDPSSPHRYVANYSDLEGRILLDIGCAEGLFSIDTINFVKEVYLFECEDTWIDALNATFEPWKTKVHIIKRYISDQTNETQTTLDTLFLEKKDMSLFLKMDIEGAEQLALQGASQLLTEGTDVALSICTYHKRNDATEIETFLQSKGFQTSFSSGFIGYAGELRKGVLRAKKGFALIDRRL